MVMYAKDLMHPPALIIDASASILDAAHLMAERHNGYALIARQGHPFGIVTEWDFVQRVIATGRSTSDPVADIASTPLVSCDVDTPTDALVRRMAEEGVRRMLITRGGEAVGIVAARDIIASFQRYIDELSATIARLSAQTE
jgi:signal-transduction protein with cAMP-binding, CBS, and nucleotidyltransferase domain